METADKARENRLRRMAERQRLVLAKSRRRDPRASEFGTYGLVNPRTNGWEASADEHGYGLTLDKIEAHLSNDPGDTA